MSKLIKTQIELDVMDGELHEMPLPNFSYNEIPENCRLKVHQYQQMIVFDEIIIDGTIVVDGDVIII